MHTAWGLWDWLQYLLSFALVIGLLLGMLWALRKLQGSSGLMRRAGAQMVVIDTIALAPRQKLAIVRIREREVLVALTPQQINLLGWLDSAEQAKTDQQVKP
jgi:flagellar protein FliO/FliZ